MAFVGAAKPQSSSATFKNNVTSKPSTTKNPSSSSSSGGKYVNVQSNGNAPAGTQVGDIVKTAGGDFKVVSAGTQGATYNPNSGLWSVKVNSSSGGSGNNSGNTAGVTAPIASAANKNWANYTPATPSAGGSGESTGSWGYTPLGTYNDKNVSAETMDKINALKDQWNYYYSIGDQNGMDQSHAAAEQLRAQYGYSGGSDGSQYLPFELEEDKLPMTGLPTYQPQTGAVNTTYDAALKSVLAQLESSYNQSKLAAEAALGKIPGTYQAQANQAAALAERNRAQFNEYAAMNGLNTGNGSQAQLAMNNQLQSDMTTINTAQANAINEANQKLAALQIAYQDAISEAVANNEYERAAALLAEFRTQAQSVVDVAQTQAQLNMSTAGFNRDTNTLNYEKALQRAETLAQFGDFSGYEALGYSADQVANMKYVWQLQNGIYR